MKNLSELYDANFKKVRGKSTQGFIRPTIGEYFMTNKDFTETVKNINTDHIWMGDVLPTGAIYPFNTEGSYNPTLRESGLHFNVDSGYRAYSRIIPEATSDVGMTVKFEVRTNQNPSSLWARGNCFIGSTLSTTSESSSLRLVITSDGIYNWAGHSESTNYYTVDCSVFNTFLWQISETSWKLFVNNQTSPIIETSHSAAWSNELKFGDQTDSTSGGAFAEWRLVGARAGIFDWNNF
jgi:hypothetical protein